MEVNLFNNFLEQKLFLFVCFYSSRLLLLRIKKGVVYMVAAPSLSEPGRIFTLRNIALGVGGITLFAGALAGSGRLLQLSGAHLLSTPAWSHVGRAATIAGEKLVFVGKGAFLSVAVPIYTVTWVVPKWILTVGIPKGAALYHEYILAPALKGIKAVAEALFHYIKQPLATLAKWVWTSVIVPGFEGISKAAEAAFHSLRLLAELTVNVTIWAWSSVIGPALEEVVKAAHWVYQSILAPASLWVWKAALLPASQCIIQATAALKISLEKSGSFAYQSLILPAYSVITEGAAQTAAAVRDATSWLLQ